MPEEVNVEYALRNFWRYVDIADSLSNSYLKSNLDDVVVHYQTNLHASKKIPIERMTDEAIEIYTYGPEAFKKLAKYAQYLDTRQGLPGFDDEKQEFNRLCDCFKSYDFAEINSSYDAKFSDLDWERADNYFTDNEDAVYAGSFEGLMYSYLKYEGNIVRRSKELGKGAFGRTKEGRKISLDDSSSAIKRQVQNPRKGSSWLLDTQKEAAMNFDLGVAISDLLIRRRPDGSIYKVYQDMLNLGTNLEEYFQDNKPDDAVRWDIFIDLILITRDLHSGNLSKSNSRYAHCDIKEPNILIDENMRLHLVDFGLSRDSDLDKRHTANRGTPDYMPISFNPNDQDYAIYQLQEQMLILETPSYYFDDKLAVLRTGYNQAFGDGILTATFYEILPEHIKQLIASNDVKKLIRMDGLYTLDYLAAVFIQYGYAPELCTQEYVNQLVGNVSEQTRIINEYRKTYDKIAGQDPSVIPDLLQAGEISLTYLPKGYRIDDNISPEFLDFLLTNNLLTTTDFQKLGSIFADILDNNIDDLDQKWIAPLFANLAFREYFLQNLSDTEKKPIIDILKAHDILDTQQLSQLYFNSLSSGNESLVLRNEADLNQIFFDFLERALLYEKPLDLNAFVKLVEAINAGNCANILNFRVTYDFVEFIQPLVLGNPDVISPEQLEIINNKLIAIKANLLNEISTVADDPNLRISEPALQKFMRFMLFQMSAQHLLKGYISKQEFFEFLKIAAKQVPELANLQTRLETVAAQAIEPNLASGTDVTKKNTGLSAILNKIGIFERVVRKRGLENVEPNVDDSANVDDDNKFKNRGGKI